jgi:hypothetical protein
VSEIGRVIDRIAADALGAPLQASDSNAGAEGRFVLNAGVYFPALAARLALFPPTDAPREMDCQVRIRPMPPGRHWWKVRAAGASTPDPEAGRVLGTVFSWLDRWADRQAARTNARATQELRQALERYALPWLERMVELSSARGELARRGPLWWAAAASLELGERSAAAQLFARAMAAGPATVDDLRRWGQVNGLEP